jgi:hypothetical protein
VGLGYSPATAVQPPRNALFVDVGALANLLVLRARWPRTDLNRGRP